MNTLTFDIETIPGKELSDIHEEELQKKFDSYVRYNNPPEEEYPDIKKMLMGTNPFFGEVVAIGVKQTMDSGKYDEKCIVGTEKQILCEWWRLLSKFQGLFISYNGIAFDVPFILKRSMVYNLTPTNKMFLDTRRFSKWPHFDAKLVMADFDRYAACTLRLACEHNGIKSPKEGDIAAKDVAQAYEDGRIKEIAEYCMRDVQATYDLYNVLRKYTYTR